MTDETESLSLKVLHTDKLALQRLATAEGEPMSVVVRRILRNELRRSGFLPLISITRSEQRQEASHE
mgnify:CR=1 FL=1